MIKKSWKFSKVLFYFHFILEWARRGQRSSNSFPFSFLNLIESKALENTPSNLQKSKRQLSFMVLLYCFPLLNWFWTILCIYHHCYSIYFTNTTAKTFVCNSYILGTMFSVVARMETIFTNHNIHTNTSILILTNLINQLIIFPIQ